MAFTKKQTKLKVAVTSLAIGAVISLPTSISAEEEHKPSYKAYEFDQLTDEQKATVIRDVKIDLKDVSACSIVHLSYSKNNQAVQEDVPVVPVVPNNPITPIVSTQTLPSAGGESTVGLVLIGMSTFTVGLVLLYKDKKGKVLAVLLLSSTISGFGYNHNLNVYAQDLLSQGNITFVEENVVELPRIDGYQYVGYWVEDVACPEVPKVEKLIKVRYAFISDPNMRDIRTPVFLTADKLGMSDYFDEDGAKRFFRDLNDNKSNQELLPSTLSFTKESLPDSFKGNYYETNPAMIVNIPNQLFLDINNDNQGEQLINKVEVGSEVTIEFVKDEKTNEIKEIIIRYKSVMERYDQPITTIATITTY